MKARDLIGFAFGPAATAAIGLLTVPLVAWTFSAEDVGRYNLFQSAVSFLLLLSTLGLDQAYVREFHETEEKSALLRACGAPGIAVALVLSVAIVSAGAGPARLVYGLDRPSLAVLTLLAFLLSFVSRFLSLSLRMQERGLAFSLNELLPKALVVGLLAAVAISGVASSFSLLLAISVAAQLTAVVVISWSTRAQWRPALSMRVPWSQYRTHLHLALPLLVSSLAYWGLTTANVIALRNWSSLSEVGVFALSLSIANAAGLLQAMFTVVWAPIVYKWVGSGADVSGIDDVAEKVLALVCAVFVVFGATAPLITVLLPPEYEQVRHLVLSTIVPPLLYTLSEVTGIGITIARRTTLSIWVTGAALATSIVAAIILVPAYGARGAAVANAFGFLCFFIGRTEASRLVWRQMRRARLYTAVCAMVACAITTTMLGADHEFLFGMLWLGIGGLVAVAFADTWVALRRDAAGLLGLR